MKNIKWFFLLLSILAVIDMILIGFAIGLRNVYLTLAFVLLLVFIMGIGFRKKKDMEDVENI